MEHHRITAQLLLGQEWSFLDQNSRNGGPTNVGLPFMPQSLPEIGYQVGFRSSNQELFKPALQGQFSNNPIAKTLMHAASNIFSPGNALRLIIRKRIIRRLTNRAREHLSLYLPGVEYDKFHACTEGFDRIGLNGYNRMALEGKASRKGLKHDSYTRAALEPTIPKSETRQLKRCSNSRKTRALRNWLSFENIPGTALGAGGTRVIKLSDLAIVTDVTIKFISNKKSGNQGIRISFSWVVYQSNRVLKFNVHSSIASKRRIFLRRHVFDLPAEIALRGCRPGGVRIKVDKQFFETEHFYALRRAAGEAGVPACNSPPTYKPVPVPRYCGFFTPGHNAPRRNLDRESEPPSPPAISPAPEPLSPSQLVQDGAFESYNSHIAVPNPTMLPYVELCNASGVPESDVPRVPYAVPLSTLPVPVIVNARVIADLESIQSFPFVNAEAYRVDGPTVDVVGTPAEYELDVDVTEEYGCTFDTSIIDDDRACAALAEEISHLEADY